MLMLYHFQLTPRIQVNFIKTITYLSKNFAGINLEDISAPRCFEIEKALSDSLDIPSVP